VLEKGHRTLQDVSSQYHIKEEETMAHNNVITHFQKLLLQFITEPDPLLAMLQWLTEQLMQLEAEEKIGAPKGKHSQNRSTHFSGNRVRRFDTRMGTMYLLVPKLPGGWYIPFFVVERKRSEQALIQVVQEAFFHQWGLDPEDRAVSEIPGNREPVCEPGE
jgi:hypothetical protein